MVEATSEHLSKSLAKAEVDLAMVRADLAMARADSAIVRANLDEMKVALASKREREAEVVRVVEELDEAKR